MKTGKCSNCEYIGSDTHLHHIVPLSRGGCDVLKNIVELCEVCHGNVHNTSFDGVNGLVKLGVVNAKKSREYLTNWLDNNEEEIHDLLMDFYNEYETDVLTELLTFNALPLEDLYCFIFEGRSYKGKGYGELPTMLSVIVKDRNLNIDRCFLFEETLTRIRRKKFEIR